MRKGFGTLRLSLLAVQAASWPIATSYQGNPVTMNATFNTLANLELQLQQEQVRDTHFV